MRPAVIEKVGDEMTVTLHASAQSAMEYAVLLATENECDDNSLEVREHLEQDGSYEQGDWGVFVCDALEIS